MIIIKRIYTWLFIDTLKSYELNNTVREICVNKFNIESYENGKVYIRCLCWHNSVIAELF